MNDNRTPVVLNVGCGMPSPKRLPARLQPPHFRELRLDIDPDVRPDFVASITDMRIIADASVDVVFSSHNLEHLHAHEVPVALAEFRRVLKPGGHALIQLPDLQAVAEVIAKGNLTETLYTAPAGPVSPLDIVYGHGRSLAGGKPAMAHKTGFTAQSLGQALTQAGFASATVRRRPDIWGLEAEAVVEAAPASDAP